MRLQKVMMVLLAVAAVVSPQLCFGAAEERLRPKIGVALSGGGARGCAHVGVLKVLEELNIPVDYIAGTSMGAIIGGFYAAGLSPAEIEDVLVNMDWNEAFVESLPRQDLSYRRKEDDKRYPFDFELGFKNGRIRGPSGMLSGQNLNYILRRVTLHVPRHADFDELAIPYRAVATDLDAGEAVVISHGDLARAMRASMSIPGVFSPVEIDGRRLIDGGVVNNLPVDVVRSMGADIVIAVNVRAPLNWRGRAESMLDISAQAVAIAIRQSDKEQAKDAEVVITPDLREFSATDFDKAGAMIDRGEAAAFFAVDQLAECEQDSEVFSAWLKTQRRVCAAEREIDYVRIEGNKQVDERLIKARISTCAGDVYHQAQVGKDLLRVYGLGEFEWVGFVLERTNGVEGLVFEAHEKPWGPNYLHAGLELRSDFEGNNTYGVLLNYTRTRLNALGGEWRNDFRFGEIRGFSTEIYQPLTFEGHFFIAPGLKQITILQDIYNGDHREAEYSVENFNVYLDVGSQFGKYGEFRVGPDWGAIQAKVEVGPEALPSYDVEYGGVKTRIVVDRLDNAHFPRGGSRTELGMSWRWESMGGDDTYRKLYGAWGKFASWGKHTVFAEAAGGSSLHSTLPEYDKFLVGGLFSLAGYGEGQLRGSHFGAASLGYYWRIFSLPSSALGQGLFLGVKFDAGNVWEDRHDAAFDDLRYAMAPFLGADTALGPIYLGYGIAEHGIDRIYFSLGSTF